MNERGTGSGAGRTVVGDALDLAAMLVARALRARALPRPVDPPAAPVAVAAVPVRSGRLDACVEPAVELDALGTIVFANEPARGEVLTLSGRLEGVPLSALAIDARALLALFGRTATGERATAQVELIGDLLADTISEVTIVPIMTGPRRSGAIVEIRRIRRERRPGCGSNGGRSVFRDGVRRSREAALARTYQTILAAGARLLGLESGAIFRLDLAMTAASVGEPFAPELSLHACHRPIISTARDLPAVVDREGNAIVWPVTFIGVPVRANGETCGSVCFAGNLPRAAFDKAHHETMMLIAAVLGHASESESSRAYYERLAFTDSVTGLANRAALFEAIRVDVEAASLHGERFGVILVDLDRFKSVNDSVGHDAGDAALRGVGERLGACLREGDVAARLGGDEFAVLVGGNPDRAEVAVVAERVREAIAAGAPATGDAHRLTGSLGVAMFPQDGAGLHALLKSADLAMYRAKERGRNTFQFYSPELAAPAVIVNSFERDIRLAIEAGQFEMYYQPQHDTISGALYAVEALIRWNHPTRGVLLPHYFIPEAEKSRQIIAIGDFVLERACTDIAALRATMSPDLRVAVNLSARNFHQPHLAEKLVEYAEAACLVPSAVELEITETIAMGDAALTTSILEELHELGFILALDDFGTGYSSLGYLREFPVHAVKIDRSFVMDLPTDQGCMTIVKAVIAMAHALGLEVVAEGVETAEQLRFLRSEHCDRWQGFLFAPALRLGDLKTYIDHGPHRAAVPMPYGGAPASWPELPSLSFPWNRGTL